MKRFALTGLILVFLFVFTVPAQADKLSDARKEKSSIDNKLGDVKDRQREARKKLEAAKAKQQSLSAAQKARDREYREILSQIDALNKNIEEINNSIEQAEEDYNNQQELLKDRLVVMYEDSSTTYLQTLLQSKNIMEFLEKLQLISLVSKNDRQLLESIADMKKEIETKKSMALGEKRKQSDLAKDKMQTIQKLSYSRANVEQNIEDINTNLKELEKQEDALLRQSEHLNSVIRNLLSKRKYSGGIMRWPVPSSRRISSSYGMRFHPILKKMRMHTGIDIPAPKGNSIVAANSGTVIIAGYDSAYGNMVILDHGGGISTLYGHSSKLLVRVGDKVKAGEVIAKVGSTGYSTGPHLHFEVRINGSTVNPLKYVSP